LARLFVQQKATFVQIEQEMASDGLLRMGQGVLSETARNPTIPKLPSNQASKYVSLLDRTQMYLNVMRRKESTEFELPIVPRPWSKWRAVPALYTWSAIGCSNTAGSRRIPKSRQESADSRG
jgi:hypothetical protein